MNELISRHKCPHCASTDLEVIVDKLSPDLIGYSKQVRCKYCGMRAPWDMYYQTNPWIAFDMFALKFKERQ